MSEFHFLNILVPRVSRSSEVVKLNTGTRLYKALQAHLMQHTSPVPEHKSIFSIFAAQRNPGMNTSGDMRRSKSEHGGPVHVILTTRASHRLRVRCREICREQRARSSNMSSAVLWLITVLGLLASTLPAGVAPCSTLSKVQLLQLRRTTPPKLSRVSIDTYPGAMALAELRPARPGVSSHDELAAPDVILASIQCPVLCRN